MQTSHPGPNPAPSQSDADSFDRLLKRSAVLAGTIADLLDDATFDGSPRGEAVLTMCDIAYEHAASLRMLLDAGLPTSGVAMLRLQYEALLRATWLSHAAADSHVAQLKTALTPENEQAAKKMPSINDMLADLTRLGPPGAGRLLARFRDRLWHGLNSFVHGGIHPVRRKADGYPLALLSDLVKSSNAVMFLTTLVMAELTGDEKMAARFLTLNDDFTDCVPAPEPFPDS